MDVLKRLQAWLTTFPKWEEGKLMYLDFTDGVPGNQGLFPQGQEVLQRKEDVLGNISLSCRYHFALYRITPQEESAAASAGECPVADGISGLGTAAGCHGSCAQIRGCAGKIPHPGGKGQAQRQKTSGQRHVGGDAYRGFYKTS